MGIEGCVWLIVTHPDGVGMERGEETRRRGLTVSIVVESRGGARWVDVTVSIVVESRGGARWVDVTVSSAAWTEPTGRVRTDWRVGLFAGNWEGKRVGWMPSAAFMATRVGSEILLGLAAVSWMGTASSLVMALTGAKGRSGGGMAGGAELSSER